MDKRNLKKSAQHTTPLSFSGYFDSRCLRWRGLKGWVLEGMEENKKSASPKKNCAYSLRDSIVFVDKWVNCLFGCFPHPLYGGGGWVAIFRNYSAMQ